MFKIARNDKCWCGCGKKYKQCHERSDEENLKDYLKDGYPLPDKSLILTKEDIAGVKESGKVVHDILDALEDFIKIGVTTQAIDNLVASMMEKAGATSATLGYNGFPKSCCTSINNVICHGIPDGTILKDGDIINVDITTLLNGYYADSSRMYLVGDVSEEAKELVETAKQCMIKGIEAIKPYTPVAVIGNTINDITDKHGYGIVRDLCGHGVGLEFHGDPVVNHFRNANKTMILVPGMVLTVEPMVNAGTWECNVSKADGWTVTTKDNKLSAQWEHTILVTEDGAEILT